MRGRQIPAAVTDPSSPLYNKGRCWILGGDLAIAQQSQRDWHKFLNSRAAEMVPGGIVLATCSAARIQSIRKIKPTSNAAIATWLARISKILGAVSLLRYLTEFGNCVTMPGNRLLEIENILAYDDDDGFLQGVITAETRDAFNLPIYCPSKEEVESAVAKNGAFDMQCVEWSDDSDLFLEHERLRLLQNPHKFATFYSAWVRAMVGPIVEAHMGLQATNEWFVLYERRMVARATSLLSNPKGQQEYKFLAPLSCSWF